MEETTEKARTAAQERNARRRARRRRRRRRRTVLNRELDRLASQGVFKDLNLHPNAATAATATQALKLDAKGPAAARSAAKKLANRTKMSPSAIRRMARALDRLKRLDKVGERAWLLWGGEAGDEWSNLVVRRMERKLVELERSGRLAILLPTAVTARLLPHYTETVERTSMSDDKDVTKDQPPADPAPGDTPPADPPAAPAAESDEGSFANVFGIQRLRDGKPEVGGD